MKKLISIMAIAGSRQDLKEIDLKKMRTMYDTVYDFVIPSDHGEFPDTSGYTDDNWDQLASTMEDSQLWPHMTKCMDAVVDFVTRRADALCNSGYINVRQTIQWPKEGGKIFMVVGFVSYEQPNLIVVPKTPLVVMQ